ncbi:MAG: serine/threonine-protein kinase [Pirellulaceae bacterium]
MDAARYARIRELFLEAEELPPEQQVDFLQSKVSDDQKLIEEVCSLLKEHDAESARLEGERATPVRPPMMTASGTDRSGPSTKATMDAGSDPNAMKRIIHSVGPSTNQAKDERRQSGRILDSTITQQAAQRTHASPRYADESTKSSQPRNSFWDRRTRRNQRLNSGWLWLAAVLPTALIGSWTYWQVAASQRDAKRKELSGLADSVMLSTDGFLGDRADLVESWSRQAAVRQSILELVDIAKADSPTETLKKATQTELIKSQLQEISGFQDVSYVVWDRAGTTLASSQADRADVGTAISPSGAANLSRVMRGERVLFGPARLSQQPDEGIQEPAAQSANQLPENDAPVMANLVPVRNAQDQIVAALMVRGIDTFNDFDEMFRKVSVTSGLDVYAVDRRGVMITNSPNALNAASRVELELMPDQIAANLRVSDPGYVIRPSNVGEVLRSALPLTISAANATTGRPDVRVTEYNNYAGVPVVGAWRWNEKWHIGVLVEHDSATAFAPARIVRFSFLILGTLLTITAFLAAKQIAKQTSRAHAAVHPLSRYELISELGSGGMGVVYHARHKQLGRETALKVLRNDRQSGEDRMRFDREARLAASLSNPHSVMIYDYGRSEEGEAFCVMEFLRGITLYEIVARSGHQQIGRVLLILRQICDALAEAHNLSLLHRDIKPQNVMLSLDPSVGDWAVVFDFGLAKPLQTEAGTFQTAEMVWAGTPMYMAPERYREPGGMDPRSDIYSVGCIAYFLLTGRPPYMECDPETLFALVLSESPIAMETHRGEKVPQPVIELVDRCMAKRPDERFATVEELSAFVDQIRSDYPWTTENAREWWAQHGG